MKTLFFMVLCLGFLCIGSPAYAEESVGLTWDPNSEEDLAGYRIYSGPAENGPWTLVVDVGNEIEATISLADVPEGIIWYAATAYDTHGNQSDYSIPVSYLVDHTAPNAPTNIVITIHMNINISTSK